MQLSAVVAEAGRRLEAAGLLDRLAGVGSVRVGGVETVVVTVPLVAPTSTPRLVAMALSGLPHECIGGDYPPRRAVQAQTVVKDNRTWRVGTQAEVDWISTNTAAGHAIGSVLPPGFDAYALVVIPEEEAEQQAGESALLRVLGEHTTGTTQCVVMAKVARASISARPSCSTCASQTRMCSPCLPTCACTVSVPVEAGRR